MTTLIPLALLSLAASQPQQTGHVVVTREDLVHLVRIVESQVAHGELLPPLDGLSGLARTNDEFDRITQLVHDLRLADAALSLEVLRLALEVDADRFDLSDNGLRADLLCDDRWCKGIEVAGDASPPESLRVRVRGLWPWVDRARETLVVQGEVYDPYECSMFDLDHFELGELSFDGIGRPVPTVVDLPVDVEEVGLVHLSAETEDVRGPFLRTVDGPPASELRAEIARRLDRIDGVDPGAARALRSRLALRWEAPSMERSAEFTVRPSTFRAELLADIDALERGVDPFALRAGEHWRTFAHGRRDLAARVYLPADAPTERIPLVIAFHGTGGDECIFPGLTGNGDLERVADAHGCLVVTPFTPDFLWSAEAFDSLLAGIGEDFPVDLEQVYVFGHSMGTAAVTRLCRERPDRVAGACCVAGFDPLGPGTPPTLVVQGERDRIVPARAVELAVEASKGADVTYVELEDQGHTLLLPDALDLAFERWFE